MSVVGCGHKAAAVQYCNGGDSGPVVGQLASLELSPSLAVQGESLNYGQIGQGLSVTGYDCKGSVASTGTTIYATTDMTFADINPSNGQVCGGTWNRNIGGGIADYTLCTAPGFSPTNTTATNSQLVQQTSAHLAYLTATANGITSNAIPVYVHPSVSSIVFGKGTSCSTDPDTTCCPADPNTVLTGVPTYDGTSCVSQNQTAQLAARVFTSTATPYAITSFSATAGTITFNLGGTFVPTLNQSLPLSGFGITTVLNGQTVQVLAVQNTTAPYTFTVANTFGVAAGTHAETGYGTGAGPTNITCQAGHLNFGSQGSGSILTLDQNGVATANQPGSAIVTAQLANSSSASSIGFFSTCPPVALSITPVGQTVTNGAINVAVNNTQPFTTNATDKNGVALTGLNLTFLSSNTQLVPISAGTVQPVFPGSATVVAACLPPACNPASADQLGLNGNGKAITSTGVVVTATGRSTSAIYIASTDSQYVLPLDFSTSQVGSIVKLPFVPNSMAIGLDGATVYFGSDQGLMTLSTANNAVSAANQLIPGRVISVSPDGGTVVVTDPTRQVIELVSGGSVTSSFGGIATHAAWSTDASTVYVTTQAGATNGTYLLTHSNNSNWQRTPITGNSGSSTKTTASTTYNDVAIMVPSIGAYFAGDKSTDGRSYCPKTTPVTPIATPPVESNTYAPLADVSPVLNLQRVIATTDQQHILGASASQLADLAITSEQPVCTQYVTVGNTSPDSNFATTPNLFNFAGVTPSLITGVVPSSNSAVAFVTFTGAGNGKVPYYLPSTKTLNYLTLTTTAGTATAPVAGVFSTDNFTFYLGTAGDNAVHVISVTGTTPVDGTPIIPSLPSTSTPGGYAVPNLIVQRPRRVTS